MAAQPPSEPGLSHVRRGVTPALWTFTGAEDGKTSTKEVSAGAAASEELAGPGALEVLAVGTGGGAVDPDVLDALAAGDEAVGAGRQVPHPLELAFDADGVGVEGDEVGGQPLLDEAAVGAAEDPRRLTGQPPDRLLQRQHA